jgi:hypothetical protein
MNEPGDVVVRADQQRCRIREGRIFVQDSGVHVAVRRNDGQVINKFQEPARDLSDAGLSG